MQELKSIVKGQSQGLLFIILALFVFFFFIPKSQAAEAVAYDAEDIRIGKIAREKAYPGGRDEEDLEVQAQLVKPIRKEDAKKENVEAPASNDDEF